MSLKAAMKGTTLLVLLMVIISSSCAGASLNNNKVQTDKIDLAYLFHTENNTLLLTWTLLNPSGAVRGYRVTWNDGVDDKQTHVSETETTIGYPSNLDCHDELTVTVMALDDDNIPLGNGYTKRFSLQDVVTDVILTPEENWISASWSLKCPSQEVTAFVVIWEEVTHSHEVSCRFPGTARDTTAPTSCTGGEQSLQSCRSYTVVIELLDSSSEYIGIAWKTLTGTLEEGYGSKLMEGMKLKDANSHSATLLWKGPNPECPSSNYVLTYTETKLEDSKTSQGQAKLGNRSKWSQVKTDQTIVANLHPSDNGQVMGHVDNLKPFTEYEFCVAAGYTVTNLVCLTVQTLEAKPEKPTHLVLTNEQSSPTTIGVMWKEPSNMNGKLVNYIVRWYQDSKHAGSHNTTKHEYNIIDAEPNVNYIIAVTAVNGAGEGEAAETRGALAAADDLKTDCNPDTEGDEEAKQERVIEETEKHDAVLKEDYSLETYHTIMIVVFVVFGVLVVVAAVLAFCVLSNYIEDQKKRGRKSDTPTHSLPEDSLPERQSLQSGHDATS